MAEIVTLGTLDKVIGLVCTNADANGVYNYSSAGTAPINNLIMLLELFFENGLKSGNLMLTALISYAYL